MAGKLTLELAATLEEERGFAFEAGFVRHVHSTSRCHLLNLAPDRAQTCDRRLGDCDWQPIGSRALVWDRRFRDGGIISCCGPNVR